MMGTATRITIVVILLISGTAFAASDLELYDDFDGADRLINPDKWQGIEVSDGGLLETTRRVDGNRIFFASRSVGLPSGNTGDSPGTVQLRTASPVKTLEASVVVDRYELVDCPANPLRSQTRARLAGYFFNTGTPIPGDASGDVLAVIQVTKTLAQPEPRDVMRVMAVAVLCGDRNCRQFKVLQSIQLGTVKVGEPVILRVTWDPDNKRFLYSRDRGTEHAITYTVPNSAPAGFPSGTHLGISNIVPNCQGARAVSYAEAHFDNVLVDRDSSRRILHRSSASSKQ